MKVSIMQPYFLPYLGYFTLLKHTDVFILLDTVQFIRHGWIERNRVLKPSNGWQYIKVPLKKHSRETIIKKILINNDKDWRDRILRQLDHYKKRAPFYTKTIDILKNAFSIETDSIVKLNENIIKEVCNYIGIKIDLKIFSEMHLDIEKVRMPDDWALNICKSSGNIDEYWNPEGGLEFFNRKKYNEAGIKIRFVKNMLPEYSQRREKFIHGLSIVDVMMFNEPLKINYMLDYYSFINIGEQIK